MTKDSALRIRIQRELHDRFLEVCRSQDKPAAQVLREFMRDYVEEHGLVEKQGLGKRTKATLAE